MALIDRRAFLRDAALLSAAIAWPRQRGAASIAQPLRIGFIDASGERAAARRNGVALGVDEAVHAASMFGGAVKLEMLPSPTSSIAGLCAIIGDDHGSLSDAAAAAHIPYMNVGSSADALRGARCTASLFHVVPSDAMIRDALAASMAKGAHIEAWDPSLDRFGADTLNHRYTARFSQPMTSDAWLGWFAVKALWEASLRARSVEPGKLRDYLAREGTQFDGHKGRPLSFRGWDRQLRQPVYLVDGERVIEWPPAPKGDESSRESLDAIGTTAPHSECHA